MSITGWSKKETSRALWRISLFLFSLAVTPALTISAQSANGESLKGRYFAVVWAYQGPDDDVVHAHTFTSFYRGDELAKGVVRPATISWLPATGVVQPFGSEKGRNFSLDQTLRMACGASREVKSWGPFEIRPALYRSAMKRLQLLQSGRIRYSMMNSGSNTMNCISAAGDLTPERLDTGILWGVAAGAAVVRHLSPYFVDSASTLNDLTAKACPRQSGRSASTGSGRDIR